MWKVQTIGWFNRTFMELKLEKQEVVDDEKLV